MKTSKIIKYILTSIGVIFFLFLVIVGYIFYSLPSVKDMNRYFGNKITDKTSSKKETDVMSSDKTGSDPLKETVKEKEGVTDNKVIAQENSVRQVDLNKSLNELIDPKKPMISFCNQLEKANSKKINVHDFDQEINNKNFSKENSDSSKNLENDLRFEALHPLMKEMVSKPHMNQLVKMVVQEEMQNKESPPDMITKAQFYKTAYLAFTEMKTHVKEYESIMDRAYLMYKINDLVALKKDLAFDQRIQKFCEDEEVLFNTYQPVQFDREKESFERLLQEVGVAKNDIRYDPNYKTEFLFDFTANSLKMSGGWIEDFLSSDTASAVNPPSHPVRK